MKAKGRHPSADTGPAALCGEVRAVLAGLCDPGSPLSLLRGCPHITATIWGHVRSYWRRLIQLPDTELDTEVAAENIDDQD